MEHHLHNPSMEHEPIPGERDPTTLTHLEVHPTPQPPAVWVDDVTAREHMKEGGGREAIRQGRYEPRNE